MLTRSRLTGSIYSIDMFSLKSIIFAAWIFNIIAFWLYRKDNTCSNFLIWDCEIDRLFIIPLIWAMISGGIATIANKIKVKFIKVIYILITLTISMVFVTRGINGSDCEQKGFNDLTTAICYTNKARRSQKASLCDKIKDSDLNSLCKLQVYYWTKSVKDCVFGNQRDICLHVVSLRTNDKTICKKISNQDLRLSCEQ